MINIFARRAAEPHTPEQPSAGFTVTQDGRAVGSAVYDGRWLWITPSGGPEGVLLPKVQRSRAAEYRASLGLTADADTAQVVARTWCRTPGNRAEMVPNPAVWQPLYVPLRMVRGVDKGSELIITRTEVLHPNGNVAANGPRSLPVLLGLLGADRVRAFAENHDRHPATRPARWLARVA